MVLELFFSIKRGERRPCYIENKEILPYLKAKMEKYLKSCAICPWECHVNRFKNKGKCGLKKSPIIHIKFHFTNEEEFFLPCAMIFTSGCNLKCFYCQNPNLLSPKSEQQKSLNNHTIHLKNISLKSTSIHFCGGEPLINPQIICGFLMSLDLSLPIVFNTNLYLQKDILEDMSKICDVFITDLKFGNNFCANELSGVENYCEVVLSNHDFIVKTLNKEVVIRHLVLPGHIDCCTRPILEWFKNNFDKVTSTMLNITLCFNPNRTKQSVINRTLSTSEIAAVINLVKKLDIQNVMISRTYQDMTAIKWWV